MRYLFCALVLLGLEMASWPAQAYPDINVYIDFGTVELEHRVVFQLEAYPDINTIYQQFGPLTLVGSSDYVIESDGCSGAILSHGAKCYISVVFKPSSEGTIEAVAHIDWTNIWQDPVTGQTSNDSGNEYFHLTGVGEAPAPDLPPVNSDNSCALSANSTINVDALSLGETISIVGAPFTLNYSSDRFRPSFNFEQRQLGLGGWVPSLVHLYDSDRHILYFGDGRILNVQAVAIASGFYATNPEGTEIYYFDPSGIHQSTVDTLTGRLKYQMRYNSRGRLLSLSDGFGNTTTFAPESFRSSITSPYGQVTNLVYDQNGFLMSLTDPAQSTWRMTSDSNGLLLSFTKPMGQTSTHTYDSNGLLTQDRGAGGDLLNLVRLFDPESKIQTVRVSTALNRKSTYKTAATSSSSSHSVQTADGRQSSYYSTDRQTRGGTSSYGEVYQITPAQDPRFGWLASYDTSTNFSIPNSPISVWRNQVREVQLNVAGDPLSLAHLNVSTKLQNDPNRVYNSTYEANSRTLTETSPLGRTVKRTLNREGLLASVQNSNLAPIRMLYDSRGRLITISQLERQTKISYDRHGNVATINDPMGHVTSLQYDDANRVILEKLPDGQSVAREYDKNGNVTRIKPPGRPPHSFTYGLMDLVESYLPPSLNASWSGATVFSYNLDRQLATIHKPDGSNIQMNYEAGSGHLIEKAGSNGVIQTSYLPNSDLISRLTSSDHEETLFSYIGQLPLSESASGPVVSHIQNQYNPDASLASRTFSGASGPVVQENIRYDKDGLVVMVGGLILSRNSAGEIANVKTSNLNESIAYDQFGQMISDKVSYAGKTNLYSLLYSRDKIGRIIGQRTQSADDDHDAFEGFRHDRTFEYDKRGRLILVNEGREQRRYSYDSNGNRTSKVENAHETKASYDSQDRLVSYGETRYSYNANGERIAKVKANKSTKYEFDSFGNLKSVTLPNHRKIEFIIDGLNRRVGKKINGRLVQAFVYQTQTQIADELDASGKIVKHFIYGTKDNSPDYMLMNGVEYRIFSDQVGTPLIVVNAKSGKILKHFNFDEFGLAKNDRDCDDERSDDDRDDKSREAFELPFGFAGGLYDQDTHLVHFGARDYDPETGRWISKDPILFNGRDSNLFGYVSQDPVNKFDSSGHQPSVPEPILPEPIEPDPNQGPVDPPDWNWTDLPRLNPFCTSPEGCWMRDQRPDPKPDPFKPDMCPVSAPTGPGQ